jgi:hypothetical protein
MFESYFQNLATATLLSSGVLQHPSPAACSLEGVVCKADVH